MSLSINKIKAIARLSNAIYLDCFIIIQQQIINVQCEKHDINFYTYLCKRQWLRRGTASSTDALLDERHGKFLMWYTVPRATHVFSLAACNVKMYT